MKKLAQVKEIVETLIAQNKKLNNFSKKEIDKAIITCRGIDKRTIQAWFNVLWTFEYLEQPQRGIYALNLPKLSELDVQPILSTNQTTLE